MNQRLKKPNARGNPKVTIEDLDNELVSKVEILSTMEESLRLMRNFTDGQIISESDLEEFDDLLSTDDEDESAEAETNPTQVAMRESNFF